MLQKLTHLLVQDQTTAQRFLELGAQTASVSVLGSLKYDLVIEDSELNNLGALVNYSVPSGLCWVCGSTRSGEEVSLLRAWAQLPEPVEGTLVLVPRHPQRF